MATHAQPLFTAVSSSARQILLLLRCIAFARKVHVRVSADGLRFSAEEGSILEAVVFLEKALFSSYSYNPPPPSAADSDDDDEADDAAPLFEVDLHALLETLSIFSLSDPAMAKRSGDYDSFATHRLARHAGASSLANQPLGVTGVCTLRYDAAGGALRIHMAEADVSTTCALTTYEAAVAEDIPFDRGALALKTILRAPLLLDAVNELSALTPDALVITATPAGARAGAQLSLSAAGPLGSANIDFTNPATPSTSSTTAPLEDPLLETFQCRARTTARFKFGLIRHAQRAMAAASKVSLRLDQAGVLSLQFLVEVDAAAGGVAFVDFRVVPLVEEEEDSGAEDGSGSEA